MYYSITMQNVIYSLRDERNIVIPMALEDSFTSFVAASGMPFAPTVTVEGDHAVIHFLYVSRSLRDLAEEYFAVFEPDGYNAIEVAVPNDRVKHTLRISAESGWLSFIRQQGAERSRICFIRTPRATSAVELEERIELVS